MEIGSWDLPAISSIVAKVRFVWSPLHSRALMPKSDVKKDRGKKLKSLDRIDKIYLKKSAGSYITVKIVNTITERDWVWVTSACHRAILASSTFACFCLRSRRVST